jgi:hypothetical protein
MDDGTLAVDAKTRGPDIRPNNAPPESVGK